MDGLAIQTPRLTLRAFTEEDIDPMTRILGEEGVLRYFPRTDPPPRDRVERMIAGLIQHWAERGCGLWAVESRQTGELMGRAGLQYLPEASQVEVDFILGRDHWGRGYATEAGRASVRHGFEALGLERIVGVAHPENLASRRVLEKLGMRFVEVVHFFGMDCCRYEVDGPQYAAVSASWHGAVPATGVGREADLERRA